MNLKVARHGPLAQEAHFSGVLLIRIICVISVRFSGWSKAMAEQRATTDLPPTAEDGSAATKGGEAGSQGNEGGFDEATKRSVQQIPMLRTR